MIFIRSSFEALLTIIPAHAARLAQGSIQHLLADSSASNTKYFPARQLGTCPTAPL